MKKRTEAQRAADRLRTGRPPKPPEQKQSEQVVVYLTKAERQYLEAQAEKKGLSLSSMIMYLWRKEKEE